MSQLRVEIGNKIHEHNLFLFSLLKGQGDIDILTFFIFRVSLQGYSFGSREYR